VQITDISYIEPNGYYGRFGGEGVGLQFLSQPLSGGSAWTLNKWTTIMTRCWDYTPGMTYFGAWIQIDGVWKHLVTMNYPYTSARFNWGATSFLENYSGTNCKRLIPLWSWYLLPKI
jgi:hypothetical protein